jgi:hypothetical protein
VPSRSCVTCGVVTRGRVRLPAQGLKAMTRSSQPWPAHTRGELESRSHYAAALVGNRCAAMAERWASGPHPEQAGPVGTSDPRSAYLTRLREEGLPVREERREVYLDRGLLVGRDDAVAGVKQLAFPAPSYTSRIRPVFSAKSGSVGKIQERYCHGRIASSLSQRTIVDCEASQMPRSRTRR